MKPKKHLGQHFLTAPSYAKKISEAVPAERDDLVLEIGPGQGALTVFLRERFTRLHLIEIDETAIDILLKKLGTGSYSLHKGDVLAIDFYKIGSPLHVTGNLPYSIGALIIKKTLLYGNDIKSCTFMVQREVAQRIVAETHTKTYGFLSVFCSFFGTPRLLFHVPPGSFFPPPKVYSSVFQIFVDDDLCGKLPRERWESFFTLVSRGFQQRRKKVVNALATDTWPKERLTEVINAIGIDTTSRAEDLSCTQWLEVYKNLW